MDLGILGKTAIETVTMIQKALFRNGKLRVHRKVKFPKKNIWKITGIIVMPRDYVEGVSCLRP